LTGITSAIRKLDFQRLGHFWGGDERQFGVPALASLPLREVAKGDSEPLSRASSVKANGPQRIEVQFMFLSSEALQRSPNAFGRNQLLTSPACWHGSILEIDPRSFASLRMIFANAAWLIRY
jgi:hypothetical protein